MPSLILALALFVTNQAAPPVRQDPAGHAHSVIAALTSGDFGRVEEQFTDQMKAALPPGRLAATWAALVDQVGAFKACAADARIRDISDKRMVITACEFERAKIDIQIAFDTDFRISGLAMRPSAAAEPPYAPPAYADPAAYTETEVTIGADPWKLPGTLAMPVGAGPFPVLILVHGSGPNDRDETLGPNKPFKDLALGLASRGIAVLRYDKRSKVYGARMASLPALTVKEEVLDDVGEAIKVARASQRIDGTRVFVLGHSLGGMLIPRIGAANPSLAGVIVMAGAARPLEDAIAEQTRYLLTLDEKMTPQRQAQIDAAAKLAADVKGLKPEDVAAGTKVSNVPASYWLDLRGYDPPSAAASLRMPMLVLQGERDYQVTMAEFARWRSALATRQDMTFHTYPALNHLFIAGTGRSTPAEYQVPAHVSDDVVRDIAAWLGVRSANVPK